MALIIDPQTSLTLGQALGNIISGLVDAQARAARTTVDFIEDVGFQPGVKQDDPPTLRQVQFSYRKRDENDKESSFEVSLPLLGLVDIPLIVVRRATIDLEFQVSTVNEPPQPATPGRPGLGSLPIIKGQVLSGRKSAVDERGSIKVSVEVEKSDAPPGLSRALDILELAASERKAPEQDG